MVIHNFRPNGSGAELQAERLGKKLVGLGYGVEVLTPRQAPDVPCSEICEGLVVERSEFPLAHAVFENQAQTLREYWLRRGRYDILHAHLAFGHAISAVLAGRWLNKKVILKLAGAGVGGDLRNFGRLRFAGLGLRILRQADAFVAVSGQIREELVAQGFPEHRIANIPNGVDTDEFRRVRPCPGGARVRFILLGQFYPVKGIDVVLQACRILLDQGLGGAFEVAFFGRANPDHDFQAMAHRLGVAHHVTFNPFSDAVLDLYNDADCYLLASRSEGLSNALLEAMACELPVIATNVSGAVEVISSPDIGLIIPTEDAGAMAGAMRRIMEEPELRRRLGVQARRRVETAYSLRQTALRYAALYDALVERRDWWTKW